jgi:hypothetical protein
MPLRLLLLLCLLPLGGLFAQTFFPVPGPVLVQEVQFEQANICTIYFDNPSGDTLQLRWRLSELDLPDGWDADMCDYGLCYIGVPSTGLMSPVYDTIRPFLKLVVQPDTFSGATWLWFRVHEEGKPSNFQDVFFSLHTPGTVGTAEAAGERLTAYPNPANEALWVENNQECAALARLVHLGGAVVWEGNLAPRSAQAIPLRHCPAGLYLLQNGRFSQKIIVRH